MSEDLQLKFLDPKTVKDDQIVEVTHTVSKAFKDFNISINAATEVVQEDFGVPEVAAMVISGFFHSHAGYAATLGDGKVIGVSFVDVRSRGSTVASLGLVSSLAPGAGTMTVAAACSHAEKLGFSTLVLMQAASNSRSFSLYTKLGFEAKHVCQYLGGFLPSLEPSSPAAETDSLSLRAMTAGDVAECADLFLAAHGADSGWDRQADIADALAAGLPFPMLVATDADGKLVGYSTGFYIAGHQVAASQDVFCAMFAESSRLHQQRKLPCPRFHCPIEFPGLISWAFAKRLTTFRAIILMAKGEYDHAWPGSGFIVAPSIAGW